MATAEWQEGTITRLPVVNDGKLVGIASFANMSRATDELAPEMHADWEGPASQAAGGELPLRSGRLLESARGDVASSVGLRCFASHSLSLDGRGAGEGGPARGGKLNETPGNVGLAGPTPHPGLLPRGEKELVHRYVNPHSQALVAAQDADPAGVPIDFDRLAIPDARSADAGADYGRDAVLPGDDGAVAQHPAGVRHHGRGGAEQRRPCGRGRGATRTSPA